MPAPTTEAARRARRAPAEPPAPAPTIEAARRARRAGAEPPAPAPTIEAAHGTRERPPTADSSPALPIWIALSQACAAIALLLAGAFVITALLAGAGAVEAGTCAAAPVPVGGSDIPRALTPIYTQAATQYGLGRDGAAVLSAINWIETDFGRDLSTSSAGATGFMQFMPATWASYGLDANGDGSADPNDPWDAIFAAARYLRANGAPADWRAAVFAYNHADWYVRAVLVRAARYARQAPVSDTGTQPCGDGAAASAPLVRMVAEANRIDALRSVYVFGGGHVTPAPATPPWDCSSAWSRLLQVAGYRIPTMTSSGFMTWGDPGPGAHVTIYATPAHVYGTIDGRPWGTSSSNPRDPGGGPAWLAYSTNPIPDFPGGTPTVRHPPGL